MMRKGIIILFFYVILAPPAILGQVGKPFPVIQGETLDNKSITIPDDTRGKFTLVGIAYSKKAQRDLNTWASPVYYEFVDPSGLTAMVYDVNVCLVMLFTGANKSVYESAKKKIKAGTDKDLYPYTLLFKGALKEYKERLKLKDKDTPSFYVLDKEGTVIHQTFGAFSERKMEKISALVEN